MSFYLPQEEVNAHYAEHTAGTVQEGHRYCQLCYPIPTGILLQQTFRNFWNWFYTYHNAIGYTHFTYRAFQIYQERFQDPPNQALIEISAYLISSICYT